MTGPPPDAPLSTFAALSHSARRSNGSGAYDFLSTREALHRESQCDYYLRENAVVMDLAAAPSPSDTWFERVRGRQLRSSGWRQMTTTHPTTRGWWSYWQQSLLLKVGAFFILLSIAVCTYLITASSLSGQLTGVSKAIEQAGTERMRIYKLASLVERFTPSNRPVRQFEKK